MLDDDFIENKAKSPFVYKLAILAYFIPFFFYFLGNFPMFLYGFFNTFAFLSVIPMSISGLIFAGIGLLIERKSGKISQKGYLLIFAGIILLVSGIFLIFLLFMALNLMS